MDPLHKRIGVGMNITEGKTGKRSGQSLCDAR